MIATLPEGLRRLEPELLTYLIQDETHIMAILDEDGTVSDWKIDQIRQRLNLPTAMSVDGYGFNGTNAERSGYEQPYDGTESRFEGLDYADSNPAPRRKSRFTSAETVPFSSSSSAAPYNDRSQRYRDAPGRPDEYNPNEPSSAYEPSGYGRDRGARGRGSEYRESASFTNQKTSSSSSSSSSHYEPSRSGPSSGPGSRGQSRSSGADDKQKNDNKKRKLNYSGTKPCRLFKTAKGCPFGDKCAFAHITGNTSSSSGGGGGGKR